jgi:hypothetical protein
MVGKKGLPFDGPRRRNMPRPKPRPMSNGIRVVTSASPGIGKYKLPVGTATPPKKRPGLKPTVRPPTNYK